MPSPPGIMIRPAVPADETALITLEAISWSPQSGFPSVAARTTARELAFFNADNPPADHLVACVGPTVIGYVRLKPPTPLPENAHVIQISGIAVHPAARGQGAGSALLAASEPEAQRRGARKLSLRVLSTNTPAIRLYERHGYTREGTLRAEFLINNTYVDDIIMAKLLPQ